MTGARALSFDWLGPVALNPLIGPVAASIGTSEALAIAAAANLCLTVAVVLLPSVRGLRAPGVVLAPGVPGHSLERATGHRSLGSRAQPHRSR